MPRPLVALFAILLPLSLLAAGHDLSTTVRYAPADLSGSVPTVAFSSNHFLTLWPTLHIYGALADPANGTMPPAFVVLPYVKPSALEVTAAGSGYLAVWNQQDGGYLGTLTAEGVLERSVKLDAGTLSSTDLRIHQWRSHVRRADRVHRHVHARALEGDDMQLEQWPGEHERCRHVVEPKNRV